MLITADTSHSHDLAWPAAGQTGWPQMTLDTGKADTSLHCPHSNYAVLHTLLNVREQISSDVNKTDNDVFLLAVWRQSGLLLSWLWPGVILWQCSPISSPEPGPMSTIHREKERDCRKVHGRQQNHPSIGDNLDRVALLCWSLSRWSPRLCGVSHCATRC